MEEDAAAGATTEETGEDPTWPALRAAIPPANRQDLGRMEEEGGGGVMQVECGQSDATGKLASLMSKLAVSWRPLAVRWFLISMRSSFSEKVIRD